MSKKVFNLIILDESGSMESIKQTTISGFNELIQSIQDQAVKDPELEQYIHFFSFNSGGIREQIPLSRVTEISPLNENSYRPNNMTPLYDAIGHATGKLRFLIEKETDYAVLVTILTDGAENASREYTRQTISNIIRELETKGWTFTYMGVHQDAHREAADISIKNVIRILNSHSAISHQFLREKERRLRYNEHVKLNTMDKLMGKYFEDTDDQSDKKDKT